MVWVSSPPAVPCSPGSSWVYSFPVLPSFLSLVVWSEGKLKDMRRDKKRRTHVNDPLGFSFLSRGSRRTEHVHLHLQKCHWYTQNTVCSRDAIIPWVTQPSGWPRTASKYSLKKFWEGVIETKIWKLASPSQYPLHALLLVLFPSWIASSASRLHYLNYPAISHGSCISYGPSIMTVSSAFIQLVCAKSTSEMTLSTCRDSQWKPPLAIIFLKNWWVGNINHFKKLPPSNRFEQFVQSLYIEEFMFEQAVPGSTLTNGIMSGS